MSNEYCCEDFILTSFYSSCMHCTSSLGTQIVEDGQGRVLATLAGILPSRLFSDQCILLSSKETIAIAVKAALARRGAERTTLRLGLPSKGRMAEDTQQLLKVTVVINLASALRQIKFHDHQLNLVYWKQQRLLECLQKWVCGPNCTACAGYAAARRTAS